MLYLYDVKFNFYFNLDESFLCEWTCVLIYIEPEFLKLLFHIQLLTEAQQDLNVLKGLLVFFNLSHCCLQLQNIGLFEN